MNATEKNSVGNYTPEYQRTSVIAALPNGADVDNKPVGLEFEFKTDEAQNGVTTNCLGS